MASGDSVAARITDGKLRHSGAPSNCFAVWHGRLNWRAPVTLPQSESQTMADSLNRRLSFLDRNPDAISRASRLPKSSRSLSRSRRLVESRAVTSKNLRTRLAKFAAAFHVDMATITTAPKSNVARPWLHPRRSQITKRVVGTFNFAEARKTTSSKARNPIDGTGRSAPATEP